ncbi:MAG TPA: HgcAB-associated protein [Candidatus Glassbacteria bacterium]|nr:HgcAB-associated protein [Candidatus Glassbacteria bacterium]
MPTKKKTESSYSSTNKKMSCCKVESVVSVDDRGQMVLPKELREKAQINAGDKLVVVTMEKDGKICCLSLIKVNDMEPMVKDMLGPVMKEIMNEKKGD